jgi:hypothetical protein
MANSDFLEKWTNALEAYGTPREFVSSTQHKEDTASVDGLDYRVVRTISQNNEQRRELMKKQKPYESRRESREYGLRLDLKGCFLCQNIAQGIDASDFPGIGNNVILETERSFLMPNRYPNQAGHSLIVLKNHDNSTRRVTPTNIDGKKVYTPEAGKTRGAVIREAELAEILECLDRNKFNALRNHVLDAMSIPGHDHWHTFLGDSRTFSEARTLIDSARQTELGTNVYLAGCTPFSTLLIRGKDGGSVTPLAARLLRKMEEANEIFTLAYSPGSLFISPRWTVKFGNKYHQLGSGMAIHYLSKEDNSELELAKELIPLSGQFDWERFF